MTLILFLIIFLVVVVAHEFGHFITAKRNGIRVVEFSVGMGPKIAHIDRGGTCYSIRLLPLGGACIFEDEDQITNPNLHAKATMAEETADETLTDASDSRASRHRDSH